MVKVNPSEVRPSATNSGTTALFWETPVMVRSPSAWSGAVVVTTILAESCGSSPVTVRMRSPPTTVYDKSPSSASISHDHVKSVPSS